MEIKPKKTFKTLHCKAAITIAIRPRFDFHSTYIRLRFDCDVAIKITIRLRFDYDEK